MDPDPQQSAAWKALGDVIQWAKLQGEQNNEDSEIGSFTSLLGATMDDPIAVVGAIIVEDYDKILANWQVAGHAPTPTQKSKAALVGRGARILCGTQLTLTEERKQKEEETLRKHELEKLQLQTQIATMATSPSQETLAIGNGEVKLSQTILPGKIQKKVKMNLVADQVFDQEVDILSEEMVAECYTAYAEIFQDLPPPEEEITVEQLTALHVLLQSGSPPYVDFAVFGPHGYRLLRKLKLQGLQLTPGGDLRTIELAGPPTFGMWERCYMCLKTGLIQHRAVRIAKLLKYHDQQKRYHERYGPAVWHLQYQSEVRMRQERMIHHKRQGAELHRKALAAGTEALCPYNPKMPWDYAWSMACEDFHWWRQELEEPCILILTRSQSVSAMVDGDVDIAEEPAAKRRKTPAHQVQQSGWETSRGSATLPLKSGHQKMERMHNVSNGAYTTNRRGLQLCSSFNAGQCDGGNRGRCPKDESKAHQCSKCLSAEHNATQCSKTPGASAPSQPAWVAARASSGKGKKGKGNGKGKQKGRYYG